jgi:hypothetical protein
VAIIMRYFLTTLASRPVSAGGKSFSFEPVCQAGGSWLGVFACDDESDANILAAAAGTTLEEITADQYDAKKKHLSLTARDSPASMRRQSDSPLNHVVADRAGSTVPPFQPNGGPNSTELITRVSIFSTDKSPPNEPILEGSAAKKRW